MVKCITEKNCYSKYIVYPIPNIFYHIKIQKKNKGVPDLKHCPHIHRAAIFPSSLYNFLIVALKVCVFILDIEVNAMTIC